MVDYKEILKLNSQKYSQRQIAASVRSSHHTVKTVLELAQKQGIKWPIDDDVTNAELEQIFYPERKSTTSEKVEPNYAYIHKELARSGVTLTLLWNEYCEKCYNEKKIPYMSTQFGEKYHRWAKTTKATMRIKHKPAETMQVDWAGGTISYYNSDTGEENSAYIFVAVLPCSCYAYVEACDDMKLENWLLCHVHAYEYFGGSTRLLIPDNLKTGVTSNTKYETVLNDSYRELANHYQTAIVPARVRHPQDKGLVEGTVKLATTWIIASLRNTKFFSFKEVKTAVSEKLEELNNKPFQKQLGTRKSAFLEEEKEFLTPLPTNKYEPAIWSQLTVGNDYLVSDGKNKYSVPFDLIGEKVQIRLTKNVIEIYYSSQRVASHARLQKQSRSPLVKPEHMPEKHRKYLDFNSEEFLSTAKIIGEKTYKVVEFFLNEGSAKEQGYKSCVSLIKLSEKYGKIKLETACSRILAYSSQPSIRNLTAILKNMSEKKADAVKVQSDGKYGITRGVKYFKGGDLDA